MDRDLFLAILAMDSYNRGYGAGINDLPASGQIGNAEILTFPDSVQEGWQAAGFYAIAYDVSGVSGLAGASRVISYRGTNFGAGLAADIANGWVIGAGFEDSQCETPCSAILRDLP